MADITGKDLGLKAVRGKLLTVKEIAKFLRVSDRWVRSHMIDGTFPVRWYPIGERDHVVDSADLDDWLSKVVIEAGTAPLPLKALRKIKKEKGTPM
jgi:predicted DNA-binding transcriptional regulator AlpA